MTLQIPLSDDAEARLREAASALGKDLASFVLEAVEEKLSAADSAGNGQPLLTARQRIAELRSWAASHGRLGYEADDGRESIYEGRGE